YAALDLSAHKGAVRLRDRAAASESYLMEFQFDELRFATLPYPAWAPDGKTFLFPLKTEKGVGLFRISDDGTKKTRLTPEGVDCPRGVHGALEGQLADVRGLGLEPDRIVIQSERFPRHEALFRTAVEEGQVYPCTCSRREVQEELQAMASAPHGEPPIYTGR